MSAHIAPTETAADPSPFPHRIVVRAVGELGMDIVRAAARLETSGFVADMAFLTLLTASNEPCWRAASDRPLAAHDDALRRPVSANGLARSMHLPYETARRNVVGLEAAGLCRRLGRRGWIVGAEVLARPAVAAMLDEIATGFEACVGRLIAVGFDVEALVAEAEPDRNPPGGPPDPSVVGALAARNGLLCMDLGVRTHGSMLRAMVFNTVQMLNMRAFAADRDQAWRYAGYADAPPDELRRPISGMQVADRLGMSGETVRRTVNALVRDGMLRRVPGGLMRPEAVPKHDEILASGPQTYRYFRQLVVALRRRGYVFPRPPL